MSKILAINTGSSTLKWKLFQMPDEQVIASGMVDRLALPGSVVTIKYGNKQKYEEHKDVHNHDEAVKMLLEKLIDLNIINSLDEINGIGHRVVSGGEKFTHSVVVDKEVLAEIQSLGELAPLHNPAEVDGIKAFHKVLPNVIQVAVFDTSFHTTMPAENFLYSIPYDYYTKYKARKYGAHGTSYRYVSQRAAEILQKPVESMKIIALHLGSGASMDAILNGKSLDTSMGFTPLAGITMSTRSGDIDASLVAYLMEKLNVSSEEMIDILNTKSGIYGISGVSPDMRDLESTRDSNPRSQLAIDIFVNRIVKYFGSYAALMNGVDTVIFTAGIGEGDILMRQRIIDKLSYFGLKLDPKKNDVTAQEQIISSDDSSAKIMLIPTNEELMIARDVVALS